ncbi:hypothetical protein ACTA71_006368 [Dictyostelium dimigraforme]
MNFVKSSLTKVKDTTHQIGTKLDSMEHKQNSDSNIITDAYTNKANDELNDRVTDIASNSLPTNSNNNSSSPTTVERKREGEGLLNRIENSFSGRNEDEEERVGESTQNDRLSEKKDTLSNKFQNSMNINEQRESETRDNNTSSLKRNKGGFFEKVENEIDSFGKRNEDKEKSTNSEQPSTTTVTSKKSGLLNKMENEFSSFGKRNEQPKENDENSNSTVTSHSATNKNEGLFSKIENQISSMTGNNNNNEESGNKIQNAHPSTNTTSQPSLLNKIHNYNQQVETKSTSALNFLEGKSSNPTPTSTPNITSSNDNLKSSSSNERGFFSDVGEKVDGFFKGNQANTNNNINNNKTHNQQTSDEPKKESLLTKIGKF